MKGIKTASIAPAAEPTFPRQTVGRELLERAYFILCRVLAWLLRSAKYSKVWIEKADRGLQIRKRRSYYAPLLIWMGGPLNRMLNTGVRVLPQREWEERERQLYKSFRGITIQVDAGGTLLLPRLSGETLASLLESSKLEQPLRKRAIGLAVAALAEFHRVGISHGDATAENVFIDLGPRTAHWFDFETIHDQSRTAIWRRADDVRALLASCLSRTPPDKRAETLQLVLDAYADEEVHRILVTRFARILHRPLPFHLAQAALSIGSYKEIAQLLSVSSPNIRTSRAEQTTGRLELQVEPRSR